MEHATRARRTHKTVLKDVPIRRGRDRRGFLVALGVAVTMTAIVGFYAASFRDLRVFEGPRDAGPRWSLLAEDLYAGARPVAEEIDRMRGTVTAIVRAKVTQADSIERLKAKIGSASGTAAAAE